MTIEMARAGWRWARGWREWCFFGVVVAAAFAALAAGVHFFDVVLVVFCVCLAAAKIRGDHRWRRGWRVGYSVACMSFVLVWSAADLPGYGFALVAAPAGMTRAAVERWEEKRVEGRLRPKGQPI